MKNSYHSFLAVITILHVASSASWATIVNLSAEGTISAQAFLSEKHPIHSSFYISQEDEDTYRVPDGLNTIDASVRASVNGGVAQTDVKANVGEFTTKVITEQRARSDTRYNNSYAYSFPTHEVRSLIDQQINWRVAYRYDYSTGPTLNFFYRRENSSIKRLITDVSGHSSTSGTLTGTIALNANDVLSSLFSGGATNGGDAYISLQYAVGKLPGHITNPSTSFDDYEPILPIIDERSKEPVKTTGAYLFGASVDSENGINSPYYFQIDSNSSPELGHRNQVSSYYWEVAENHSMISKFVTPAGIPGDNDNLQILVGNTYYPYDPSLGHTFDEPVSAFSLIGLNGSPNFLSGNPAPFIHGLGFDSTGYSEIIHAGYSVAIPEPSSAILFGLALASIGFSTRHRIA